MKQTYFDLLKDPRWQKSGIYVFRSLGMACRKLGLPYKGMLGALRNERFYKGRYYANFLTIPTGIETKIACLKEIQWR